MDVGDGFKTFEEYGEEGVDGEDAQGASLEDGVSGERRSCVGVDFEESSGIVVKFNGSIGELSGEAEVGEKVGKEVGTKPIKAFGAVI